MTEPKPGTPEFGVRAAARRAKIGKKDLAKVAELVDKISKALAKPEDKNAIDSKREQEKELEDE